MDMRIIDIPEFKDKINVLTFGEDELLTTVVQTMASKNIGSAVIVKDKKILGIFTERDLLVKVIGKNRPIEGVKIKEVMTKKPNTAHMNDSVADSMRRMSQGRFRHLPIVDDDNNLIGIISQGDFVAYTWFELFNRISKVTKSSFFNNTQLWMLILGPLVYLLVLKFIILV